MESSSVPAGETLAGKTKEYTVTGISSFWGLAPLFQKNSKFTMDLTTSNVSRFRTTRMYVTMIQTIMSLSLNENVS